MYLELMVIIGTVFLTSFPPVAGSILSKMDRSVNPCEDFYSFSCGGWLKENPIPEDSSSYGIYPWLRQHVDIQLKGVFEPLNYFECVHQSTQSRNVLLKDREIQLYWELYCAKKKLNK